LVAHGADIDKLDNSDCSPLYYAKKEEPQLWQATFGTQTGLQLFDAAASGLTSRVQKLVKAGYDKLRETNGVGSRWTSPGLVKQWVLFSRQQPSPYLWMIETSAESLNASTEGWCPAPKRPRDVTFMSMCDLCYSSFNNEVFYRKYPRLLLPTGTRPFPQSTPD
jgi:hypothetical protein